MEMQLIWILALMFVAALLGSAFSRRPEPPVQLIQIVREPETASSGAGILFLLITVVVVIVWSAV